MQYDMTFHWRFLPTAVCMLILLGFQLAAHGDSFATTKHSRSLTSDSELAQIRRSISEYPKAKAITDNIIKAADEWVARSDQYVWEMIPPSDIPRAFNSSFDGCPVHGKEYFKHGNYSWIMDPFENPWKLKCPVGGEEYPSNDFMAYYKSKDKSLLTGEYPDDGWGWRKPGDKYKHWFVAYYCHWLWSHYIIPGVENLSLAYQITGDEKYARKAIVMLNRIAELYPSMDHNKQSRYAQEFAPSYTGKIVNLIWETSVISTFATAYDNVFDALEKDGDWADTPLAGKTSEQIRQNIEQNLLGEGVQAIFDRRIAGNYGMHQNALMKLAIVLQDEELTRRVTDYILYNMSGDRDQEGFYYAIENQVLREGIAFEHAPGYCFGWSNLLASVAEMLDRLGVDVYDNPKFKRMFSAYMELKVLGKHTPAIGDSGSVVGGDIDLPISMARTAVEQFGDPIFARYMLDRGFYGEAALTGYADLKRPPILKSELEAKSDGAVNPWLGSHNLGGYGAAILESGSGDDRIGLSLLYGPLDAGHAHYDQLSFELFGLGKKLIPDMGYPQFAAEDKDRPAWESHTLSHTTVEVNASRQTSRARGILNQFAVTPDVKLADVSSPDTYPGVQEYRRVMIMIGGESESPYVVDLFSVQGGKSHDYSIHGFDAEFHTEGIQLSDVQKKGTLPGEDAPYSYLFDDPELEQPDKTRSFGSYTGSAYSYLYDVQRGAPSGTWSAVWTGKDCGIRLIFPKQDLREVVTAFGNPPRRPGSPERLKFVLLRNSGGENLASRFVCVLQPFRPGAQPLEVRRLPSERGDLLQITGTHGTDIVYIGEPSDEITCGDLTISARYAVIRTDATHQLRSVFVSDGHIKQGALSVEAQPHMSGLVSGLDFGKNEVTLAISNPLDLTGRTILFGDTNYRVDHYKPARHGLTIGLGQDSPRIGAFPVDTIDPDGEFVTTKSVLYFVGGGCYKAKWLVNEDFTKWHRITEVSGGRVILESPADLRWEFTDADGDGRIMAYLYDIAPGQEFTIPSSAWVGRNAAGQWTVQSTQPTKASLPDGTKLER